MAADTSRRCDQCGVQAYWSVWIDMTEMAFCGHHFRAGETKLRSLAMAVIDHSWELDA